MVSMSIPRRFLLRFLPHHRVRRVSDIGPAQLAEWGIRGVVLDLDNTLVLWHALEVSAEVREWVRALHDAGVKMCLLSNTHKPKRVRVVAEDLGIHFVGGGMKPRRRGFRKAMEAMGVSAEETAVVGDQLFTDIWGGNRTGLRTILVEPLAPREFWGTKMVQRPLERLYFQRLTVLGIEIPRLGETKEHRGG
jgi:HAD superfamily phosphatase (TIGR01668 family)